MVTRYLVGAQHRLAGLGRDEGHALAVFRRRRDVVEARDRARRLAKGDVTGDVLDALAVDEHLPAVVERAKIFGTGSHGLESSPRHPRRFRLDGRKVIASSHWR